MKSMIYVFSFAILIFSATWAYKVNYETREVVKRIKHTQRAIIEEDEKLIMLEGEWAYLNRPDRLEKLSEHFFSKLSLMPISSGNFAKVDSINFQMISGPASTEVDAKLSVPGITETEDK